ncbi:MAG: hypothetical protein M5R36_14550 [Deltaproteobacteria bacterium]|nr:hypothetical protein [Deltaproteobacteria bacterium]
MVREIFIRLKRVVVAVAGIVVDAGIYIVIRVRPGARRRIAAPAPDQSQGKEQNQTEPMDRRQTQTAFSLFSLKERIIVQRPSRSENQLKTHDTQRSCSHVQTPVKTDNMQGNRTNRFDMSHHY